MTFQDALAIWASLKGKKLASIRPGAEIAIVGVDFEAGNLTVTNGEAQKSRSFAELRRVWDAMATEKLVHVDSVLRGSGSSRNQPETLLASLPWVEWAFIDRKKHLLLMNAATHHAGVLKQALPETVLALQALRARRATAKAELIIAVCDIKAATDALEDVTGQRSVSEVPGEYLYRIGAIPIRVVQESSAFKAGVMYLKADGIAEEAQAVIGGVLALVPEHPSRS
jgi:hypothetical protein